MKFTASKSEYEKKTKNNSTNNMCEQQSADKYYNILKNTDNKIHVHTENAAGCQMM